MISITHDWGKKRLQCAGVKLFELFKWGLTYPTEQMLQHIQKSPSLNKEHIFMFFEFTTAS